MTSTALQKAHDVGRVDGPLQGYHREWYVVRPGPGFPGEGRLKVGEPREDTLWFDRRCFGSEDRLLQELHRRGIPRIPPVHRLADDGPLLHGFIEGVPLSDRHPGDTRVPEPFVDQIMKVFAALAGIRPAGFPVPRVCTAEDRTADGESAGFLRTLICFTRVQGHARHVPEYGALFRALGLPDEPLGDGSWLATEAARLAGRPFCLLHGDLHRANFIVHASDELWTIDWELAMLGDPLYDLATHLHLMRYPPQQEREVVERWDGTVPRVLPGAGAGLAQDLPRYLAYKRAQSVYTDVVRHARLLLGLGSPARQQEQLGISSKVIHHVLRRAEQALQLDEVPTPGDVERAYGTFSAVRRGNRT